MPRMAHYSFALPLYDTFPAAMMKTSSLFSTRLYVMPSVSKYVEPAAVIVNCYTNSLNEKFVPIASISAKIALSDEKVFQSRASGTRSCTQHSRHDIENCRNFQLKSATQEKRKKTSCHWPIFMLMISILEICIFVYDYITMMKKSVQNVKLVSGNVYNNDGSIFVDVPSDSVLIYRPDRRLQVWRFVSYMFLHANWFHLGFNIIIQLLYGVPLEMMHGALRVAAIYFAGVFAGSLGTSVVDSAAYLVGASGGVYALLAAQLANILINFHHIRYGMLHLGALIIFVFCDLGYALYTKYSGMEHIKMMPSISYIAHLTGSLAGFTIALLILKHLDLKMKSKSNFISWLAFSLCMSFIAFAVVFNLINTIEAQRFEEQGEMLKNDFLHNFGIS